MDERNGKQCLNDGLGDVCGRLLDAAIKHFCEKGYERTSIRDITAEAGCNIAAVNYHFGGKKELYQQMFLRQMSRNIGLHIETIEKICAGPNPSLEDLLRQLVYPMLKSVEENQPYGQILRMMVREVLNRQIDPAKIIGEIKHIFMERLAEALMQIEPDLDERTARKAVFSIDSIMMHPFLFLEFYFKMIPELTLDEIVEQVVCFGAAGIRGCVKGAKRE